MMFPPLHQLLSAKFQFGPILKIGRQLSPQHTPLLKANPMPPTNYRAVADLAANIRQAVNDLGRDHPLMDDYILQLVDDYLGLEPHLQYGVLDDNNPNQEPFPDLVNAPVERWW